MDHRLPLKQRNDEFCGKNMGLRRTFLSSQNIAVIRYRIPKPGKGFTVLARFVKNPRRQYLESFSTRNLLTLCTLIIVDAFAACNVLAASLSEPFTLRNYGRHINCTYIALYPGTVQVIALGVGVLNLFGSGRATETGTLRKVCTPSLQDALRRNLKRSLN